MRSVLPKHTPCTYQQFIQKYLTKCRKLHGSRISSESKQEAKYVKTEEKDENYSHLNITFQNNFRNDRTRLSYINIRIHFLRFLRTLL
jgi:hypothetical protein